MSVVTAVSAQAATVSYFFDNAFSDAPNEATNQRDDLVSTGNTVIDFSGTSDAAWAAALTGVDALVIPELENGVLSTAISNATKNEIRNFVMNGGSLVVTNAFFSDSLTLLNEIFGYSLVADNAGQLTSLDAAEAAGTAFASGPATLGDLNAVNGIDSSSLDASMRNIYSNGVDFTAVFTAAFGAGNITFLGYDWFAGQDADWAAVQNIAVNLNAAAAVPLPAALPLFATALGGLGVFARRRRQA